jgi:hypothetical protein
MMDENMVLNELYRRDFRRRLNEKMVESAIFGNEDEYLCRMFIPTEGHQEIDEITQSKIKKPYVPFLATMIKTVSSFFLATMTDFIIKEVLEAIKEIEQETKNDQPNDGR